MKNYLEPEMEITEFSLFVDTATTSDDLPDDNGSDFEDDE